MAERITEHGLKVPDFNEGIEIGRQESEENLDTIEAYMQENDETNAEQDDKLQVADERLNVHDVRIHRQKINTLLGETIFLII